MTDKIWTFEEFNDLPLKQRNGCFKYDSGSIYWYKNGCFHRLDGPAIVHPNGDKIWFKEGRLHSLDGPAVEFSHGTKEWRIEGKQYTEEEFKIKAFVILNNLEKFL